MQNKLKYPNRLMRFPHRTQAHTQIEQQSTLPTIALQFLPTPLLARLELLQVEQQFSAKRVGQPAMEQL